MKERLATILLFICSCAFGQDPRTVTDSLLYGQNGVANEYPEVGLVIGIYQDGKTSYYSFGSRTKDGKEPLDSTTIFEIGSATKTFTGLLLANAIESSEVGQHDFIDNYLPEGTEFPSTLKNKIKLTDLASHQSGLPNLSNDKYFSKLLKRDPTNPFRFVDREYLYKVLENTDSLVGYRQYQYNNYAFSLLGDILGNENDQKYTELVENTILTSLQMNATSFDIPSNPNVAGLYNEDGEPQVDMIIDAANPAGGLKSNAVDLMKYLKAHLSSDKFSAAVKLTQQTYFEDSKRAVGLGWDIEDNYYQKDGDTFGNSILMRYSKSRKQAIVVLSNHQNGELVRDAVNFIYSRLKNQSIKR
ncbi:hypothetical protein DXT99_24570 [Pontibacter diazotrophicus]|uniref:Beta-lactamase-related domain-containing protein n=1 Tax=Pontibacter diazotrophicus TaxID=1400979 RepID=A0A3D8L240_9BACT|nr:serine hydrolase [Pontibacter diazotrophicus]RDV11509.1 hypothetical protein DXT99_24570 [Pontibacter diazotrophicus]